jgi:hypothetical protein
VRLEGLGQLKNPLNIIIWALLLGFKLSIVIIKNYDSLIVITLLQPKKFLHLKRWEDDVDKMDGGRRLYRASWLTR